MAGAMLLISSVLLVYFSHSINGDTVCSQDDANINCLLCLPKQCRGRTSECNNCPKKCSKHLECENVCDPYCLNGTCGYLKNETARTCLEGCFAGRSGPGCKGYCPERCIECEQTTAKCRLCSKGWKGENCDITTPSSPSTEQSPTKTYMNATQETATVKQSTTSHPTTVTTMKIDGTSESGLIGLYGVGAVMIIVMGFLGIVFFCYKCYQQCQRNCKFSDIQPRSGYRNRGPRTINMERRQESDGSSPPNTGYVYIDDDNLETCRYRPQPDDVRPQHCPNGNYDESEGNMRSPQRSPNDNYYESIANRRSTSTDAGSESSLSTWSGTLFGNLFEINDQINQNIECVSLEEYEMNTFKYLTPDLTIDASQGASLV